jgi:hypothetical protein
VEPQELVHDAVVREIQEETGLVARSVASLAFLSQHLSAPSTGFDPLTAFGFEICEWEGDVRVDEADDDVFDAAFVPVELAVERLGLNTFAPSVEPACAYLSGAAPGRYCVGVVRGRGSSSRAKDPTGAVRRRLSPPTAGQWGHPRDGGGSWVFWDMRAGRRRLKCARLGERTG